MKLNQLISYIEENASAILQKEYSDSNAFVVIDEVNFSFLGDEIPFCVVGIRYSINGTQKIFTVDHLAGLPENFFDMNETEAFSFVIFVVNLIIKISDNIESEEIEELLYKLSDNNSSSGIC